MKIMGHQECRDALKYISAPQFSWLQPESACILATLNCMSKKGTKLKDTDVKCWLISPPCGFYGAGYSLLYFNAWLFAVPYQSASFPNSGPMVCWWWVVIVNKLATQFNMFSLAASNSNTIYDIYIYIYDIQCTPRYDVNKSAPLPSTCLTEWQQRQGQPVLQPLQAAVAAVLVVPAWVPFCVCVCVHVKYQGAPAIEQWLPPYIRQL